MTTGSLFSENWESFRDTVSQLINAVEFARPGWFGFTLVPTVLVMMGWLVRRRQRRRLHTLARPSALFSLLTPTRRHSWLAATMGMLAWISLMIALAGPRWGWGDPDGVAIGRDVVLVLDLSRSMLADDAAGGSTRAAVAIQTALQLVEVLHRQGGQRTAIVVFAASPRVLVPLTTDRNHLLDALAELDPALPPPEIRPGEASQSGTRTGAALKLALESLDDRFLSARDIILISDGDDPVADREWVAGVSAARAASVPVHVIGIGDPTRATPLRRGSEPFIFQPPEGPAEVVTTRLNEVMLGAIAAEGRGTYLAVRQDRPQVDSFVQEQIINAPTRVWADDARPQPRDRSAGFLAASLLGFLLCWWWERR